MDCSSCGEKFIEQENFEKHLQSEKHKKNMLKTQEDSCADSENVSSNSKDNEVINCPVCNLSFNTFESFQIHSTTPQHALNVMLNQTSKIGSFNSADQQLNATKYNTEPTAAESVLPELNDKSYMYYDRCNACSKMFSGPEPYKQHLESQAHKKKVGLLQNQTCALEILKCEPCNKSFSGQVPYAQHMVSETHKKKLQNIQYTEKYLSAMGTSNSSVEKKDETKLWFCKICNIQCSGIAPYEQHLAGGTHLKNERRMQLLNNLPNMNGGMTSMMQINNFNDGKNLENSGTQLMNGNKIPENMSHVVNGNCEKDNGCDSVLSENLGRLVVSSDELGELIKIISPEEKIDFDEFDKSKDSASENPDIMKESENHKDDEFRKIQKDAESVLDDGVKKNEVYQICKFCNVSLYDKESAAEHFESKEHFEKRWGAKA